MDEYCEKLVRKIYHDGINYISPVKEIINLKFKNDEITPYLIYNLFLATDLIKNSRLLIILHNQSEKIFPLNQQINLKETIKEILTSFKDIFDFNAKIDIDGNIEFTGNRDLFYALLENLLSNCIRFSNFFEILTERNTLIIKNYHNLSNINYSFFNLPVKNDKFGIAGSGLGLEVVKSIIAKMDLQFETEINENEIIVKIYFKNNERNNN